MTDDNGRRGWFTGVDDLAELPPAAASRASRDLQTAPGQGRRSFLDRGVPGPGQRDDAAVMAGPGVAGPGVADPDLAGSGAAEAGVAGSVMAGSGVAGPDVDLPPARDGAATTITRDGTGDDDLADSPEPDSPEPGGRGASRRKAPRPAARVSPGGRWPLVMLLVGVLITAALGFATTRLETDASASLLMDTSSAAYHDQAQFAHLFGADPVVVLAQPASGQQLLTPNHMVGLAQLEGELARMPGVSKVYGPGTLVNTFATLATQKALQLCTAQGNQGRAQAVAAAKARHESAAAQLSAGSKAFTAAVKACAQQLAAKYPQLSLPALNNPAFYDALLLEGNGSVRPFWRAVLPSPSRALLTVRLKQNASLADVTGVQNTVAQSELGKKQQTVTAQTGQQARVPTMAGNLTGLRFTVSGTPVLMAALATSVRGSLKFLLPAALAAMLVLTLVVLRVPFRLLAVLLAALAGVWTAGAAALAHLPLTPATLAVLPVVLGLGTDYLLQSVNRLVEEEGSAADRVRRMTRAILPATGIAAAATAAGVLAFSVSSIPLVRQFGLFLALGVAMSWTVTALIGIPLLALLVRRARPKPRRVPDWHWLARPARIPVLLLVPVIVAGVAGWGALSLTRIQTDPAKLLPPGSAAVANARYVAGQVGYAGELDLVVTGPDVIRPDVVAWLGATAQRLAGHNLSAVNGLPSFLLTFNYGKAPSEQTSRAFLSRLPRYLSQSVISADDHAALVTFGQTSVASLSQDTQLIDRIDRLTAHPPAGYRAYPAGLAVVAASALHALLRTQVLLNVLALGVVLIVLLAAFRRPLLALLAVLPTVVAAGWATGAEYLLHIQATPITILLSGVVVAFATEFSVLWLSRYRDERAAGSEPAAAAEVASRRIGPAIVAAALTLIAGFAALSLSPVPMLRGFGIWCAADLVLATVAVLLVLPPLTPKVAR
jgi:predicted RND superfamily exporter protein